MGRAHLLKVRDHLSQVANIRSSQIEKLQAVTPWGAGGA
jgi:hypothetical protein